MKTILTLILLVAFNCSAQWGLYQVHYSPDQDWSTFRWEVIYEGNVIAAGGVNSAFGYSHNQFQNNQTKRFFAPNECVTFRVYDPDCDGFSLGINNNIANIVGFTRVLNNGTFQQITIDGNYVNLGQWTTPIQCVYNFNLNLAQPNGGPCIPMNSPCNCPADLNGDGMVGNADLLIFQQLFGTVCGK